MLSFLGGIKNEFAFLYIVASKLSWRKHEARPIKPRRAVGTRAIMELQTSKEILAEVFGARPGEMEEMIRRRLEESRPEELEEGLWQATYCLGE